MSSGNSNKQQTSSSEVKGSGFPQPTEISLSQIVGVPNRAAERSTNLGPDLNPTPIVRGVSDITNTTKYRSVLGDSTMNNHLSTSNSMFDRPSLFSSKSANPDSFSAGKTLDPYLSSGMKAFYNEPLSVEATSVDMEEVSEDAIVPDMPSYVEKYTSFTSHAFPHDIIKKILEIFKELSTVDYELYRDQYIINGTTYQEHASCNFRVNIFKNKQVYVVEFQRRSGDSMVFNSFYRQVKAKSAELMVDATIAAAAADNNNKFAPPSYDIVLDAESLIPLQDMAESPYVDVAREGMKMLARCSSTPENYLTLAKLLPIFSKFLTNQNKDEELARYTAFTLANLSKHEAVSDKLKNKEWMDVVVDEMLTSQNREISRQLAQVVNNLSQGHTEEIKNYSNSLKKLLGSTSDLKLKTILQSTIERIDL